MAEGGAQAEQCVPSSLTSTTLTTEMGISPGTTYLIRVAAATTVGLGPFSGNLRQMTMGGEISTPPDAPVTATTITINLPSFNVQEFRYAVHSLCNKVVYLPLLPPLHTHTHTHTQHTHSHFWVVALITDPSIDTAQQPTALFMDNSSFTTYSSSVSQGTPYIVAEISSMNYLTTFVLGADSSLNDFPELYRNGPLQPNTEYTAFVWAYVQVSMYSLILELDQPQGCIHHKDE